RGCGRQQVEVEFARQPLLDNLEMEETEKSAPEAEPERHGSLGFVFEARVVEAKLREAVAQPLEIGRIGRKQAAKNDKLHRLETGQRCGGRPAILGDRVADLAIGYGLDTGGAETHPPPAPRPP